MLGLMQQRPLLISSLLDYAERYHAGTEIVSRSVEGPIHRSTWGRIAIARETGRQRPAPVGRRAERAHRHPGLEPQSSRGNLFRRHVQRCRAAHGEPTPVPRSGALHPRGCRVQLRVLRRDVRAAGRTARAATAERARLRRAVRARCAAVDQRAEPARATKICSVPRATTMPGRCSTRTSPRRCATPPARPAIPRACCRATARPCCTASA